MIAMMCCMMPSRPLRNAGAAHASGGKTDAAGGMSSPVAGESGQVAAAGKLAAAGVQCCLSPPGCLHGLEVARGAVAGVWDGGGAYSWQMLITAHTYVGVV